MSYDAPPAPAPVRKPEPAPTAVVLTAPVEEPATDAPAPAGRRTRSLPRLSRPALATPQLALPTMAPRLAAVVTGVVVALVGSLTLWGFLLGCTAVRGVSSCGGVGLLGIALALTLQGVVGSMLLGALAVSDATSSAVLGVGLSAAVAMVLLYASVPMLVLAIAMLVLTPTAFVVAIGVTSATVDLD